MKHVLVVDDEVDLQEAICEVLEAEGYATSRASNGIEALDCLRKVPTCVVLLDLTMPVMDGWEFRRRQLGDEALAKIPVVLVTADGNAREKAEKISAQGFLQKPFRPDDLLRTVAGYCPRVA
jgi:two-component system, chemotaxis family, chemotaxis protein CheY